MWGIPPYMYEFVEVCTRKWSTQDTWEIWERVHKILNNIERDQEILLRTITEWSPDPAGNTSGYQVTRPVLFPELNELISYTDVPPAPQYVHYLLSYIIFIVDTLNRILIGSWMLSPRLNKKRINTWLFDNKLNIISSTANLTTFWSNYLRLKREIYFY